MLGRLKHHSQYFGRKLNKDIIDALILFSLGDTLPDVTFVLDVSPAEAARRTSKRGTSDRFEQEAQDFQTRIRQGFDWLKSMEDRSGGKVIAINSDPSIEDVHNEIYRCVAYRIGQLKEGSLKVNEDKRIIV